MNKYASSCGPGFPWIVWNCPVEAVTVRAGVGCAYAIAMGLLRGKEPSCGE
jgi:hypothetical protein